MTGKLTPVTPYAILPSQAPRPDGKRAQRRGLAKVDGRTKEAQILRHTRAALLDHLGHEPSIVEAALIDRICWLQLKVALVERKISAGTDTDYDSKSYLSWSNALAASYLKFGRTSAAERPPRPSLAEALRASRDETRASSSDAVIP